MRRPIVHACALGVVLVGLVGCHRVNGYTGNMGSSLPRTPVMPPPGMIYERVQAPLSVQYDQTRADAPRTGTATTRYLYIPIIGNLSFAWDDASIETAARNGGITEVEYADYEAFQVLGVYGEFTVMAHGR